MGVILPVEGICRCGDQAEVEGVAGPSKPQRDLRLRSTLLTTAHTDLPQAEARVSSPTSSSPKEPKPSARGAVGRRPIKTGRCRGPPLRAAPAQIPACGTTALASLPDGSDLGSFNLEPYGEPVNRMLAKLT